MTIRGSPKILIYLNIRTNLKLPPPRPDGSRYLQPQIAILDFGSQYSHLIARRVREMKVYCELYSCQVDAEELVSNIPQKL